MQLLHILISKALASGNIAIIENDVGHSLAYRWCGVWLTLATLSRQELKDLRRSMIGEVRS